MMREAILLAILCGFIFWLIDPLLGSVLRAFIGLILSMILGNLLPRNIRGTWHTTFVKDNVAHTECAQVRQMVDRVFGEINFSTEEEQKKYRFYGTIRGDVLVATYDLKRHSLGMDRGAFTLRLKPGNKEMIGRYSWTDDTTGEVKSDSYVWKQIST